MILAWASDCASKDVDELCFTSLSSLDFILHSTLLAMKKTTKR